MADGKRKLLLNIGQRLFSEKGYKEIGIEDVVQAAGVSAGTFYNYFESKEAFYGQILDDIENTGIVRLEKIIAQLHSPLNKLRVVYRFATLGIKNNPMLRGVLAGDERYIYPGTEVRRVRGDDVRARAQHLVVAILKEGMAKSVFRSNAYNNPGLMLAAIYDAILLHSTSDRLDDLMEDMLLLLRRGLRRQIQRNRDKRVDRRYLRRSGMSLDDLDNEDQEISD